MSRTTELLRSMDAHETYRWATDLFDHRDYYTAAEILQHLVDNHEHDAELGAARELLARAYYHSAQLGRAERVTRAILADDPDEAYANLVLGRTLQRQGRHSEAKPHLAMAELLGGYAPQGRLPRTDSDPDDDGPGSGPSASA